MGCFSRSPETPWSDSGASRISLRARRGGRTSRSGTAAVWRLPSKPAEHTDGTADSCDVCEGAAAHPGVFGAVWESVFRSGTGCTEGKALSLSVGISLRLGGGWRHV